MTNTKKEILKQMEKNMRTKNTRPSSSRIHVYSSRFKMNHERKAENGEKILKEKILSRA